MAKNKAKISSTQRDKNLIAAAKKLKSSGILSKQAKLHGGHYISKGVAAKVKKYLEAADLGYRAVPVSRKVAAAAKERGFQVVGGNKIIGPPTRQFTNRLKRGELTGVRPVRGGMMEEVILPHSVFDMQSLVEQLESGIDSLKLPDEQFAFKYHGNESYRAFMNTQQLLEYLRHYKGIFEPGLNMKAEEMQEEFANFTVFRLHPSSVRQNIRGPQRRAADRRAERARLRALGILPENIKRRKSLSEKLQDMHPDRANRIRKRMAETERKKREARKLDPAKYSEELKRGRERAKRSYDKRKGK